MESVQQYPYYGQQIAKPVRIWLIIGLVMVFFQVVIGGITRLTGSGLSITKWEIVTGTLPPLNETKWEEEFDKYKETPQYQKINEGMSLSEFKFIYFWEYFHRLWARSMGFVFIIPFVFFVRRKWIPKRLLRRLGVVILLAAIVASFGWIMVASGLIDRPWVSAYKLTLHLSLALVLFGYLFWTLLTTLQQRKKAVELPKTKRFLLWITIVACVQIMLGGLMSGMKAALWYPTFPDMRGEIIPNIVLNISNWNVDNFVNYDATIFMSALVQVLHRGTAYLLIVLVLWFFFKVRKQTITKEINNGSIMLVTMLTIQVLLGIFTLINSVGKIPVDLGVLHQAGAIVLLAIALYLNYQFVPSKNYEVEGA